MTSLVQRVVDLEAANARLEGELRSCRREFEERLERLEAKARPRAALETLSILAPPDLRAESDDDEPTRPVRVLDPKKVQR